MSAPSTGRPKERQIDVEKQRERDMEKAM